MSAWPGLICVAFNNEDSKEGNKNKGDILAEKTVRAP